MAKIIGGYLVLTLCLSFAAASCMGLATATTRSSSRADQEKQGGNAWYLYDHEYTKNIVQLQIASNCAPDSITNWTCKPCMKLPGVKEVQAYTNSSHGAQGYVGYDSQHDRVVIAFEGSHNLKNWLADFDFKLIDAPYGCSPNVTDTPVPLPTLPADLQQDENVKKKNKNAAEDDGEKAHGYQGPKLETKCQIEQGFYQVYQDLQTDVRTHALYLMQKYPTSTLIVTGHSLGASVATNCAMDMLHWLPTMGITNTTRILQALVTMGSPRTGNHVFARWATDILRRNNVYVARLVHNSDIVPKLPTQSMGYVHIAHEVWYPYGHDHQTSNSTASERLLEAERLYKSCTEAYTVDKMTGELLYVGEDPACSDSVIFQNGVLKDHMVMMGLELGSEPCN